MMTKGSFGRKGFILAHNLQATVHLFKTSEQEFKGGTWKQELVTGFSQWLAFQFRRSWLGTDAEIHQPMRWGRNRIPIRLFSKGLVLKSLFILKKESPQGQQYGSVGRGALHQAWWVQSHQPRKVRKVRKDVLWCQTGIVKLKLLCVNLVCSYIKIPQSLLCTQWIFCSRRAV